MYKDHNYYVYIMMSISGVLYIGVTNSLRRRITEHKNGLVDGFTKTYQCKKIVYFEQYSVIDDAIRREKQLKNWRREWKINLIKEKNRYFDDLSVGWN
ncbi:MAG: excinuclease ABC subunit C [Candidatus Magasanikbacteria bacterium CG_4_10_14_0_8_um_filter_32_14]|uniref:Excinuclease ABC subunit C n=2 Tax=Candidatus Magasanikiibacteriota TaxID=1752731 RepID=A0A2M7RAY7_9BACT|nr:MAG: excinuclease ABC subunit C [Candidatus Magasanikbacteria bacterium CG1_02_32_51]PIY93707.1 MAG: excinuclease ABC subunit C [Candidatus Magasanikbacteria bacterium CG_4_10_14_0_8_um_filter_32_14]